jgi:hypothetical protein
MRKITKIFLEKQYNFQSFQTGAKQVFSSGNQIASPNRGFKENSWQHVLVYLVLEM